MVVIIKRVLKNDANGTKLVIVPRFSDIAVGDYVSIQKINMKESVPIVQVETDSIVNSHHDIPK